MENEKACAACTWSRGDFDFICVNLESDECGGVVYVGGYCDEWEGMTE